MLLSRPAVVRALPFAVYMLFLAAASLLEWAEGTVTASRMDLHWDLRWLYPVKTVCVVVALAVLWRHYSELRTPTKASLGQWLLATACGAVVFAVWINLDGGWWSIGHSLGFDPRDSRTGELNLFFAVSRIAGAALAVPVMEELFWRSFLLRWIKSADFMNVRPRDAGLKALAVSSLAFGLEHAEWAAGIAAGLAYAWLYIRSGNLWLPVYAHGLTNLLLGLWVLYSGRWEFW